MASKVRQIGLVPAGCQPWNLNMVAGSGPSFAYCATLAVYIYQYDRQYGEYKLTSINASHTKTITCISWNKDNPQLFATGGSDKRICVYDVTKKKCIAQLDNLKYIPKCIGWLPGKSKPHKLAFCTSHGPISLWDTSTKSYSPYDHTHSFSCEITLFRWHHTDSLKFVVGHSDGSLSLFYKGKKLKHHIRPSEDSDYLDIDPVLNALWDPLSSDYMLVSRRETGIQLIDVKAATVITQYKLPSKMASINTLSWIDSAPGMFITGDYSCGIMRLWSASHSNPLESINLKPTGFHGIHVLDTVANSETQLSNHNHHSFNHSRAGSTSSMSGSHSVPPARVVCTFGDGGVGLYNLQHKKWEFIREQGHIETIFDCKYKPDNPKLLATASFDGTVKVWDIDSLTTKHTTAGNEGVIYSISWSPGDLNCIACGTRKRGVFIWDINKSTIIKRFKEHGGSGVFCVAWNQRDSHRLASCSDDYTCVVRRLDGQLVRRYSHPCAAYGCEWSSFNKDLLATGGGDGIVRVWDLGSQSNNPHVLLEGHTSRAFHVRWHPLLPNILCSGSDDKSIRVWDISSKTCRVKLSGHTACVRGLSWNYEIPFLLFSGSWDSSLRLWDVRDGSCVETVEDHGADVYGLASHPLNPFTVATTSRDSTLRAWTISPLTENLFLNVIAGFSLKNITCTVDECMKPGAPTKLSGAMSKQLLTQIDERKNQDLIKMRWFSELFSASRRLENVWDLICVVRGQRESSLSRDYKNGILHVKHLTKYKAAEAQETEHSLSLPSGGGSLRHKENALMRAAEMHLRLGNMKRHCEILVQLEQWERAISLAPSVSMAFWSQLSARYAALLQDQNDSAANSFYISTGHVKEATEFMTSRGEFQDALLLAQVSDEGDSPEHWGNAPALNGVKERNGNNGLSLVGKCSDDLAERYFYNADPLRAACVHLAHNDVTSAVNYLVRANNLSLALCVARNSKSGEQRGGAVAARLLALKCESLQNYDVAIKLLNLYDQPEPSARWSSLHAMCARCGLGNKEQIHIDCDIPTPTECLTKATEAEQRGDHVTAMTYYMLSNEVVKGLECGLEIIANKIRDNLSWTIDEIYDELAPLFCARSDVLKTQKNKTLRSKLLAYSAYFGALLAVRRKYHLVVKPLFQHAKAMADICAAFDSNFPLSPSAVQEEMLAWINQPDCCSLPDDVIEKSPDVDVIKRMRHKMGVEGESCMEGVSVVGASNLPSHSDVHVSTISGLKISGSCFFLEDKRSVLSLNEAIMWAKCHPFSPTASGERIFPF